MAYPFGVTAPWYSSDFDAFNLYAMDCEDRKDKIEQFIDLLALQQDPNDGATQEYLFGYVGLNPRNLTMNEIEYIEKEVSKKWPQVITTP